MVFRFSSVALRVGIHRLPDAIRTAAARYEKSDEVYDANRLLCRIMYNRRSIGIGTQLE